MIEYIKENKLFFVLIVLYAVTGAVYLMVSEHADAVIYFSEHRTPVLNFLAMYGTHIGDGLFYLAVIAGMFIVSRQLGLLALICYGLPSLVIQFLKRVVFSEYTRPSTHFDPGVFKYVDGVEMFSLYSFPSGHSATAFSLALFLTLRTRNPYWAVLFFAIALFTTFTRIYLAQHYFVDTYAGALLGVVLTLICYFYASRYLPATQKIHS